MVPILQFGLVLSNFSFSILFAIIYSFVNQPITLLKIYELTTKKLPLKIITSSIIKFFSNNFFMTKRLKNNSDDIIFNIYLFNNNAFNSLKAFSISTKTKLLEIN